MGLRLFNRWPPQEDEDGQKPPLEHVTPVSTRGGDSFPDKRKLDAKVKKLIGRDVDKWHIQENQTHTIYSWKN